MLYIYIIKYEMSLEPVPKYSLHLSKQKPVIQVVLVIFSISLRTESMLRFKEVQNLQKMSGLKDPSQRHFETIGSL